MNVESESNQRKMDQFQKTTKPILMREWNLRERENKKGQSKVQTTAPSTTELSRTSRTTWRFCPTSRSWQTTGWSCCCQGAASLIAHRLIQHFQADHHAHPFFSFPTQPSRERGMPKRYMANQSSEQSSVQLMSFSQRHVQEKPRQAQVRFVMFTTDVNVFARFYAVAWR